MSTTKLTTFKTRKGAENWITRLGYTPGQTTGDTRINGGRYTIRFYVSRLARDQWAVMREVIDETDRPCDIEFGNDHDHDDVGCAEALAYMADPFGGSDPAQDLVDAHSREAQEASLGRPLFPNEY